MKAAVWHEGASALRIENIAEPEPVFGSAVVAVEAGFVSAVVQRMADPGGMTLPPYPFVPGMDTIGRVVAVADDVVGLSVGDQVYCDHFYGSHGVATVADRCFLGSFGIDAGSRGNMARWRNGNMAQKLMLPAECMTPVGAAGDIATAAQLCRMGWYGTAYGGFLNAGLKPGETVIINGATGMVGASGVLLALAMGVTRVVALGRRRAVLDQLEAVAPGRVTAVALSGGEEDASAITEATGGGADVLLDAVGKGSDPAATMSAMSALAPGGRAALVGTGLSGPMMLEYSEIMYREISVIGSLWYPREGAAAILDMVAAGTLDVSVTEPIVFGLDQANEAAQRAYESGLGLQHVVIAP